MKSTKTQFCGHKKIIILFNTAVTVTVFWYLLKAFTATLNNQFYLIYFGFWCWNTLSMQVNNHFESRYNLQMNDAEKKRLKKIGA